MVLCLGWLITSNDPWLVMVYTGCSIRNHHTLYRHAPKASQEARAGLHVECLPNGRRCEVFVATAGVIAQGVLRLSSTAISTSEIFPEELFLFLISGCLHCPASYT